MVPQETLIDIRPKLFEDIEDPIQCDLRGSSLAIAGTITSER